MTSQHGSRWTGVFPAANCPMFPDGQIDEGQLRSHLAWIKEFAIGGLTINGHAGELESLAPEERQRVIAIAREVVGPDLPIIAGVTGLSTQEAVSCAKDAKAAGADCLLVMPIPHFAFGAVGYPHLIVPYFEAVAEATELPLVIFRYGRDTGLMYSVQVLKQIASAVPTVVAIKDSSFEYESAWVAFRDFDRKINFLVAHGSLFLIRFATSDGAISSFANVAPDFIIPLFQAAHAGDMDKAELIYRKVKALSDAIYGGGPLMQHWVIEKEALVARGRFTSATVRGPFQALDDDERARVRQAVADAGLMGEVSAPSVVS